MLFLHVILPNLTTCFRHLPNWKELRWLLRTSYDTVQRQGTTDGCHLPRRCHTSSSRTSTCPKKIFLQSYKWTNNRKSPVKSQHLKMLCFPVFLLSPALDESLQGKKHPAPLPPPSLCLPFLSPLAIFTGFRALRHIPVVDCVNKYEGKKKNNNQPLGSLEHCQLAWVTGLCVELEGCFLKGGKQKRTAQESWLSLGIFPPNSG